MGFSGEGEVENSIREFEVVVVGGSPLMVFEAVRLSQEGKKVAIIDRKTSLGGAWYIADLDDFEKVEMGCHYIERSKVAYDFFEGLIGEPLEIMNPRPYFHWWVFRLDRASTFAYRLYRVKKILLERDYREFFEAFIRVMSRFFSRKLKALNLQRVSNPNDVNLGDPFGPTHATRPFKSLAKSDRKLPYRYPREGCKQIVEALERICSENNVEVIFDTSLLAVDCESNDPVNCLTTKGILQCDELILSSCSQLNALNIDGDDYSISSFNGTQCSVVLHVKGEIVRPFTYFEIVGHDCFARVSNVGIYSKSFLDQSNASEHLIAVQVSTAFWENHKDSLLRAEKVLENLISLGTVSKDAVLCGEWSETFENFVLSESEIEKVVSSSNSKIRFLYTFNMSWSIERYAS